MDASITPRAEGASRLLIPWLSIGTATGFMLWVLLSGSGELQQVPVGLGRYFFFAKAGLAAAGALCAILWFGGFWSIVVRLSYVSCIFYLGFLKVLGWDFVPWVLIAVTIVGFVRVRKLSIEIKGSLLLLHVMGVLTGLYMAFNLNKFLQAWEPFKDVIRSLWLLIVELFSRLF